MGKKGLPHVACGFDGALYNYFYRKGVPMTKILLISHILIAIISVMYTAYVLVMPTRKKISSSGWLVGSTIATGTVLVLVARANLVQACLTGLLYTAVMFFGLAVAKSRLSENPNYED